VSSTTCLYNGYVNQSSPRLEIEHLHRASDPLWCCNSGMHHCPLSSSSTPTSSPICVQLEGLRYQTPLTTLVETLFDPVPRLLTMALESAPYRICAPHRCRASGRGGRTFEPQVVDRSMRRGCRNCGHHHSSPSARTSPTRSPLPPFEVEA
jgi:hypothetical protein